MSLFPTYLEKNLKSKEIVDYQLKAYKEDAINHSIVTGITASVVIFGSAMKYRRENVLTFLAGISGLSFAMGTIEYIKYLQLQKYAKKDD